MKTARPSSAKKTRTAGSKPPDADGLPVRQLKLVGVAALLFGIVTGVVMSWDRLFPVAPEQLMEVAWTHECGCAHGWIESLRAEGFVVRDHEMDNLSAKRRQWQVPDSIHGCHPATYLGYILDGHVPPDTLRRLAQERPPAVALLQVRTPDPRDLRFELLAQDGARTAWP